MSMPTSKDASQSHESHAQDQVPPPAISGTSYLIFIQLASRILTFTGNQVLLRFLSPNVLGIAFQLELYSVTVLYFSRESLRVALQRQPSAAIGKNSTEAKKTRSLQTQTIINASYITIAIGLPLTVILGLSFQNTGSIEVLDSPFFSTSLQLYAAATILEILSEPAFVVIQERSLYKARAASETLAACSKCLMACLSACLGSRGGADMGVLPFAIGQLAYGMTVWVGYLLSVYDTQVKEGISLVLQRIQRSDETYWLHRFYRPIVSLSFSMYIQSGVKQLLSQADSYILVAVGGLEDQGAFALASNYGGLIARIVFQPIEESCRNVFGNLLSHDVGAASDRKHGAVQASRHLSSVLHFYSIIAIFAFFFAPSLLPLVVGFVIGPRWFSAEVASIIASYAVYIPFMAFNGITEAFVSSVASTKELRNQAVWMTGFTFSFAAFSYVFLRLLDLGASGLVYANATNMLLRTIWSWRFIDRYLHRQGLQWEKRDIMPSTTSIATGIAIRSYLYSSSKSNPNLSDLVVTLGLSAVGGLIIAFFERRFLLPFMLPFLPQQLRSLLQRV